MKFTNLLKATTAFAALSLLVVLPAHANIPVENKRINLAEKVRLVGPVSLTTSGTVATSNTWLASPINGWITGIYCAVEGPAATVQGTSATLVLPKIAGVSSTLISATIASGTLVGAVKYVTATVAQVSTTNKVSAGQGIQLLSGALPGSAGGVSSANSARCTLEITPNYYY